MRKKVSPIFYSLCLILYSLFFPVLTRAWEADDWTSGSPVATLKSIEEVFGLILGVVLRLFGIVTFIMILVGGFKYLTSGGDPKNTESAQKTITYGVLGLVLAIAAWFILSAISSFTNNPNILEFVIPS